MGLKTPGPGASVVALLRWGLKKGRQSAVVKLGGNDREVLAVNDLGEECYAAPAVADGRIHIRTRSSLYSFGRMRNGK